MVACFALSERHLLLSWWHQQATQRVAVEGSWASRLQLNRWQQDMPTIMASAEPEISELELILEQPTMAEAYRTFALHLGPQVPIPRFCTMLSTLAEHCLLHRFDARGDLMLSATGFAVSGELHRYAEPVHLVSLLIQQVLQLWWAYNHQAERHLESNENEQPPSLRDAIIGGDYLAAQAAARQLSQQPDLFWHTISELLLSSLQQSQKGWIRALNACYLVSLHPSHDTVAPHHAAAVSQLWQR